MQEKGVDGGKLKLFEAIITEIFLTAQTAGMVQKLMSVHKLSDYARNTNIMVMPKHRT